jgi:hypothetical protein
MFRFVRWLFSLFLLAVGIWFATTIPLGKRTLWGHLRAIFATQEAKDLADGAREEAQKVAARVREELHHDAGAPAHDAAAPPVAAKPLDPIVEKDRKDLDKLIHEKTKTKPKSKSK